jgi:hypothetical protein
MLNKKHSELKPLETKLARVKAIYASPKLRTYGAVNQLTAGRTGSGGDSSSMRRRSERAVKENIVRIGTHPAGFGLYLFDYKPAYRETAGFGRQFGVMADEVETILPQAVVMGLHGCKTVDYALLGIDLADQGVH